MFFSFFLYFSFLYWDFNGIFQSIPVTFFHILNSNLTPEFAQVAALNGIIINHAAIGKLHIIRIAGSTTSDFKELKIQLPNGCTTVAHFVDQLTADNRLVTITFNNITLDITSSDTLKSGTYLNHWFTYYGA